MWDVCLLLLSVTAAVWGPGPLLAPTGLPFACAALCGLPSRALPASVHVPWAAGVQWGRLAALVVVVDGLQAVHRATHAAGWARACASRTPCTTAPPARPRRRLPHRVGRRRGAAPLPSSPLWLVRPDRTTAAVFGVAYAQWLVLLHSRPPRRSAPSSTRAAASSSRRGTTRSTIATRRATARTCCAWDVAAQRAAAWRAAAEGGGEGGGAEGGGGGDASSASAASR